MAIFNSYVKLPEGNVDARWSSEWCHLGAPLPSRDLDTETFGGAVFWRTVKNQDLSSNIEYRYIYIYIYIYICVHRCLQRDNIYIYRFVYIYIYIYDMYIYIYTYLWYIYIYIYWLVVWRIFIFHSIWDVILPIDELIFFKMVIAPPTSIYIYIHTCNRHRDIPSGKLT